MSYLIDSSGSLRCSHEIRADLWNTSSTSPLVDHFSSLHLNFLSYETRMLKTIVLLNSSLVPRAWQGLWGRSQGQGQSRGATCGSEKGPGDQGSSWVGNGATSTAECRCWRQMGAQRCVCSAPIFTNCTGCYSDHSMVLGPPSPWGLSCVSGQDAMPVTCPSAFTAAPRGSQGPSPHGFCLQRWSLSPLRTEQCGNALRPWLVTAVTSKLLTVAQQ